MSSKGVFDEYVREKDDINSDAQRASTSSDVGTTIDADTKVQN